VLSVRFISAGPVIRFNSDFWLMRFIEFGKSVPLILLVLIILQLTAGPGMWILAFIISFFLGLNFAKYARFATLNLSQNTYMDSMKALGYPDFRIVTGYLIPGVIQGMGPLVALSIANVVLLESALSYLGLGLPVEEVTLGGIMQSARNYPYAWWAVVFPGLCIFWIIYCFQALDDSMSTRLVDQEERLS
jgi:peptide/nickel transport system permease protein